jgi:aspartate-semialdehyde dehydrogenase
MVGVVGATGTAGAEIVRQLRARGFPCAGLRFFGTMRTAGAVVEDEGCEVKVELLGESAPQGVDVAFFAAGPAVARAHAPGMVSTGTLVVDVSSAFRMDPSVPLVVPEVNAAVVGRIDRGIVAIPSPTATVLAAVLAPLGAVRPVTRVVGSTYQGAGSAGTRSVRVLGRETIALLGGREGEGPASPVAFECRPLIGPLDATGGSSHERAVEHEIGRVLGTRIPLQMTAVRVPVFTGLGVSLVVELGSPATPQEVSDVLRRAPGLLVHAGDQVPTLRDVAGSPAVHVGRIRRDPSHPTAIALWVAADSVVKGKAAAAVSAAEIAIRASAA